MKLSFIKTPEKRRIVAQLNEQFGITELPYLLIKTGKEKLRAFSGHLSKDEIKKLSQITNIEIIGIYLIRKEDENTLRLSLDATHLLANQIKNNILEISLEQLKDWLKGIDLNIQAQKGMLIIKHSQDFLGSGKSTGNKILNYIPKDRRLRK